MTTTELVDIVTSFCEMYSGINFYPYQEQFARRIIRSVLTNDGNEISALFSRQCIPEGELIHTREGGLVKIEDHPDSWVTNESAEVLQISIKGGYTLKCTANHPVMTDKGWLQAGLLKAGDKVEVLLKWDKFEESFKPKIVDHTNIKFYTDYYLNTQMKKGTFSDYTIPVSSIGEDGEELGLSNVESIKKLEGTYRVYDVTYPDKGWFICNGVKVHNSGKSETVSVVSGGMMVILPKLANTPMFAEDPRLQMFKNGLMIGIFAPSQRQAQTTYGKIRSKVESDRGLEILSDPEFNLRFTTSNGTTVALSNGSFVTAISASDGSNIEGESFHVIICEECLPKGTPVATTCGLKNIEDIIEGDSVLSYNHTLGVIEPKRVERSFSQPLYGRKMVNIHLSNGEVLRCTDNHKIFLTNKDSYFRADLTSLGDSMLSCINTTQEEGINNENRIQEEVFITSISIEDPQDLIVYDLTVEDNHNFFANSVLVHNCQDISDFKLKKCLTGDTRVLLEDGSYKRLDHVVKDSCDEVVCFNNDLSDLNTKDPTEFYDNGVQPVYRLTLNNGSTIKATLNHQFLTFSKNTKKGGPKFRTVQDILDSQDKYSGLSIGVPDSLPFFSEERVNDYEIGLLLGHFIGDGCFTSTSPAFVGEPEKNLKLLGVMRSVLSEDLNMVEYNKDVTAEGTQSVHFTTPGNKKGSNPLKSLFKQYGLNNKLSYDKHLPLDTVYSKSFYKGLIEGLIETDGSIEMAKTKPRISYSSTSLTLINQIIDILLKFGIHAVYHGVSKAKGFGGENNKPLHFISIKTVKDLNRFADNFELFTKKDLLEIAINTVKDKQDRNSSKHYPASMRFYNVSSIEYVGEEPTYCLKVEGRNFIANNMISSNSIHPMGAAYNASIIKIGTASTRKGDFYNVIQRNKKEFEDGVIRIRNHFEYDYKVVSKYNEKYRKYIEQEKRRLGEKSDEFLLSYALTWILQRGMFIDIDEFEARNVDPNYDLVPYDKSATHVVGIDVGGASDSTVITVCEVDWTMPVVMESRTDEETGEEIVYQCYNTYVKAWHEIKDTPNFEEQYVEIMHFLSNFKIARLIIDATKESALADRINANTSYEVVSYVFSSKSKSDLYKTFEREVNSGRVHVPGGEETKQSPEYLKCLAQLQDLEKSWRGAYMVVSHPPTKDGRDDFPDSLALAIWGCMDRGEVSDIRGSDRRAFINPNAKLFKERNQYTARRRR